MTFIPFIGQGIIRPSRPSIPKSTRREWIPLHSPLRTKYDCQTEKQTTTQHSLVQPPISENVSTNIRHKFLSLVDKHFPKDHKLRNSIINSIINSININRVFSVERGLVSKETVVLRRWESETRKFGLSTELTM